MKILIIRHAEPDYEHDTLTAKGFREAQLLSEQLKREQGVVAIYSSPLPRALLTATPTAEKLPINPIVCDWLREFVMPIGKRKHVNHVCAWDWMPEDWVDEPRYYEGQKWMETDVYKNSGLPKYYKEVCDKLDEILAKHGYVRKNNLYKAVKPNHDTIMIFCHFGLESVLLSHILGIPLMVLWHNTVCRTSGVTTLYSEERLKGNAIFRMCGFSELNHLYIADEEPSFSARFCECFDDDTRHY